MALCAEIGRFRLAIFLYYFSGLCDVVPIFAMFLRYLLAIFLRHCDISTVPMFAIFAILFQHCYIFLSVVLACI